MPLLAGHQANFETMLRAAGSGDLALLECHELGSGAPVAVICAANRLSDGGAEFVPLATLFDDNPYERLMPPGMDNPSQPPQPPSEDPHNG